MVEQWTHKPLVIGSNPIAATILRNPFSQARRPRGYNPIKRFLRATVTLYVIAITITHDINSMRRIADEVALLFGGKIMWRGKADKIDDVANPYIDQFIHGKLALSQF